MRETKLTLQLTKILREGMPGAVVFKHADQFTSGIPDISVTWWLKTSWWEAKVKGLVGTDLQARTMIRISRTSLAHYILYEESETKIIRPDNREVVAHSHIFADHGLVLDYARRLHRA